MVLKKTNCSVNSGNTMRPTYFNRNKLKLHNAGIMKFYFNPVVQPANADIQNDLILESVNDFIDDGGLEIEKSIRDPLIYSLNKQKRWLLPERICHVIDYGDGLNVSHLKGIPVLSDQMKELPYKIVLYERSLKVSNLYFASSRSSVRSCIGYHDSKSDVRHTKPSNTFSCLTDLRPKGQVHNHKKKTPSEAKTFHNQHFRGIQRSEKSEGKRSRTRIKQHHGADWWSYGRNLSEFGGEPEVRYEVTYPRKMTPEKDTYNSYDCNKWSYWITKTKSLAKCKSLKSKPSQSMAFRGYCWPDIHEATENWEDHTLAMSCFHGIMSDWEEDDDNAFSSMENEERSTQVLHVSLESLIEQQKQKRVQKDQSKLKMKSRYKNLDLLKLAEDDIDSKGLAVHSTKQYSQGSVATYEDVHIKHSQIESDFDVELPPRKNLTNTFSIKSLNIQQEIKDYEASFTQCQVFQTDILPQFLSQTFGTAVQIGNADPFGFVVDLATIGELNDQSVHSNWYLVCWAASGDNNDCDPWKEPSTCLRVVLQGNVIKENLLCVNEAMRSTLMRSEEFIHGVKDIVKTARECLLASTFENLKTKSLEAALPQILYTSCAEKSISANLFGSQFEVSTAREIHKKLTREEDLSESGLSSWDIMADSAAYKFDAYSKYCATCFLSLSDDVTQMTLLPCYHKFCQNCWQNYVCEKISQGETDLECMQYKCKNRIDTAVIICLVPPPSLTKWFLRCQERSVLKAGDWKWCPQPGCLHVVKISNSNKCADTHKQFGIPVICGCGWTWCYRCQGPAHWPATCHQADTYNKMLLQNGDESGKPTPEVVTFFVSVKHCPKCHNPMEKSGGCSHMQCHCKHDFCWECLGSWNDHFNSGGLNCAINAKKETTMELDNAVVFPLPIMYYKKSVAHRHKWKSMKKSEITLLTNQWIRKQFPKNEDQTNFAEARDFIRHKLQSVKEIHILLEHTAVLMSNLTKASRCQMMEQSVSQLEFICSRMENIIHHPRKQPHCDKQKLEKFLSLALTQLQMIARLSPKIQALAMQKKQKILEACPEHYTLFK